MSSLLQRPTDLPRNDIKAKYELLNLTDNPFPAQPMVDKKSSDPRINGQIYEVEIRRLELDKIMTNFITESKSSPNHLRLGYIIDTSYIGRGNGKSAFLIKLNEQINNKYCLDISKGINKCFSIYISPEPGGRCKSFPSLVDLIFNSIYNSNIIETCLATFRLEAIKDLYPIIFNQIETTDEIELVKNLNNNEWFTSNSIDLFNIVEHVNNRSQFNSLNPDFPLFNGRNDFFSPLVSKEDFKKYYITSLNRPTDKMDFVFSELIAFFQAASFNGGFLLIDDFERIPDFQSGRQRKDFALELRTCLFDGFYRNSRYGFYSMLLVLHAGVPGLISDAWAESGLDNRAPISPKTDSKHVIPFEKLNKEHAVLLIKKYLSEYRINKTGTNTLEPFTEDGVGYIGEMSEYNASSILKIAYELIEMAANDKNPTTINKHFIERQKINQTPDSERSMPTIDKALSEDLLKKTLG